MDRRLDRLSECCRDQKAAEKLSGSKLRPAAVDHGYAKGPKSNVPQPDVRLARPRGSSRPRASQTIAQMECRSAAPPCTSGQSRFVRQRQPNREKLPSM